jgi:hypothetical protein
MSVEPRRKFAWITKEPVPSPIIKFATTSTLEVALVGVMATESPVMSTKDVDDEENTSVLTVCTTFDPIPALPAADSPSAIASARSSESEG